MNPQVLILAGLYDFSIDLVIDRLTVAGVPFLRLNREQLPDLRITLDPLAPSLEVRSNEFRAKIRPDLRAIWFRQPVFLRNTPPKPLASSEQLSRSQWAAFQRSLCVFDQTRWMNHPQATYLAESKPYQLQVARRCGFQVPATLAGNDARSVHARFPGSLVVKSLDTVLLREGSDCLFTYTTVGSSQMLDDGNTAAAPLLAQQLLDRKTDIRVTVVGERVFAVRIQAGGSGIEGDWRTVERDRLTYEDMRLDSDTASACLLLARRLGLPFAAIDLAETPDGIFFIEVNPTGEWAWLNADSRPIAAAIADWLVETSP
jgi:hypothetical protein